MIQVPTTLVCGKFLRFENRRILLPLTELELAEPQVTLAQCDRFFAIVNQCDHADEPALNKVLADHLEEIGFHLAPGNPKSKSKVRDDLGMYEGDVLIAGFEVKLGFKASSDAKVQSAAYYINALASSDSIRHITDVRADEKLREMLILNLVGNFLFINLGIRRKGLVQVATLCILDTKTSEDVIGLFRVLNFLKETTVANDRSIVYPDYDQDKPFSDLKLDLLSALPLVEGKTVFTCQPNRSEKVFLKASDRYCVESHQLLARLGLAPKLLGHRSFKGEYLVAMELLEGFEELKKGSGFSKEEANSVASTLVDAISALHNAGFEIGRAHV